MACVHLCLHFTSTKMPSTLTPSLCIVRKDMIRSHAMHRSRGAISGKVDAPSEHGKPCHVWSTEAPKRDGDPSTPSHVDDVHIWICTRRFHQRLRWITTDCECTANTVSFHILVRRNKLSRCSQARETEGRKQIFWEKVENHLNVDVDVGRVLLAE